MRALHHRLLLPSSIALLVLAAPLVHGEYATAICDINGTNACTQGRIIVDDSPIVTIRGYLYDPATQDRPSGEGYVVIRSETTLTDYRVSIVGTEVRPDVIAPVFEDWAAQGRRFSAEDYAMLRAGFIARTLADPLPAGVYSVVDGYIKTANGETVRFQRNAQAAGQFELRNTAESSVVSLVDDGGNRYPLDLVTDRQGKMSVYGYPPLRDGGYRIEASSAFSTGAAGDAVDFVYERPVIEIDASFPIVQGFPGIYESVTLNDTLTGRPIDQDNLVAVLENPGEIDRVDFHFNGLPLQANTRIPLERVPNSARFGMRMSDQAIAPVDQVLELFLEHPDAPNLRINAKRWNPADVIEVTPSKPELPRLVEEVDLDADITTPSKRTCERLRTYENGDRLWKSSQVYCAIRWNDLHDGFDDGFRSNSKRGVLRDLNANVFGYTPGIIATDYVTDSTQFYPAYLDGSVVVNGTEPLPIQLAFEPDDDLEHYVTTLAVDYPDAEFVLSESDRKSHAGDVHFEGAHRYITTRITYPNGDAVEYDTRRNDGRIPLEFSANTLWAEYPILVESWYTLNPDSQSTMDLRFIGVPEPTNIILDDEDRGWHTYADVIASGFIGDYRRGRVNYDQDSMGEWEVRIFNGNDQQIGESVLANPDGSFEVNIGRLDEGDYDLYAQARLLNDVGDVLPHEQRSKTERIRVYYGGPIAAELSARETEDPVPFRERLRVNPTEREYGRLTGSILWDRQLQDGTWAPIITNGKPHDDDDYIALLEDPKQETYRARVFNRYSGEEYVTEPLTLHAYVTPQFEIPNPGLVMAGQPVTVALNQLDSLDVEFEWAIPSERDPYVDATDPTGTEWTFTPTDTGIYHVVVVGREINAPMGRESVTEETLELRVVNPIENRTTIIGPRYMEAGQTYRFTAVIEDFAQDMPENFEVTGYWSLADGTRVDGLELDYVPRPDDDAISFYTYAVSQPEKTDVTSKRFTVWEYVWPEIWNLELDPTYLDVPAIIHYQLDTPNVRLSRATHGEEVFYNWILPPGVEHRPNDDDDGYFVITETGEFQVAVEVSDERGNAVTVTSNQFSILPAAAVEIDPLIASEYEDDEGNYIYYAPGEYVFKAEVIDLPRDDSLASKELYIDGNFVDTFHRSLVLEMDDPGEYDVTFRVNTTMGNSGEVTQRVTLVEPPAPSCELTFSSSTTGRYVYLIPECSVEEGRISSYDWHYLVEGSAHQSGRSTLTLRREECHAQTHTNISLTVTSNLGGSATFEDLDYSAHCPPMPDEDD